jgi:hypothetical protein
MPLDSIWARQLAGYFEDFFHGSGRKPQGMPVQERQARSRSDLALLPAPDPSAASYTLPDGAEDGAPPETTACTSLEFWPVAPSQPRQRNSEVKLRIAFAERDCYKSTRSLLVGRLVVSDSDDNVVVRVCDLSVSGTGSRTTVSFSIHGPPHDGRMDYLGGFKSSCGRQHR